MPSCKRQTGAFGVDRTRGLPPTKRLLHRLSYEGENENENEWGPHHGIEPGTSRLQGGCSDRLSYAGERRARGVLPSRARHRRAGPKNIVMCRLRESSTRPPRYEGGALPAELSRRKIDKWPAAALPQSKATLQQGLPLRAKRGAAGQFWTFTMSNSKASTLAETMSFGVELRMHVTFTRTSASRRALHATCGIADIDRQHARARTSGCGRCATREGENLCLREL